MTLWRTWPKLALAASLVCSGGIFVSKQASAIGVTSLTSGSYTLALDDLGAGHYGVGVYKGTSKLDEQTNPLSLQIKNAASGEDSYQGSYTSWTSAGGGITATGSLTTSSGSRFDYTDQYSVQDGTGAFLMQRTVMVGAANSADKGFATRYALYPLASTSLSAYNMFAPGNWYKQNSNVVAGALASDYADENFFIKETRLPLPLVMMQTAMTGESLSFIHKNANLTSAQSESTDSWLVDGGFQFGSIGVKKSPRPTLNFIYPSTEGDKNYYGNDQNRMLHLTGLVRRSHPVQAGFSHAYSLVIKLGQDSTFAGGEGSVWKYAYGLYNPAVVSIDANTLYNNDLAYFAAKYKSFANGASGLPWSSLTTETGDTGYHLQSGFVGQQTKVGWELIRDGYKNNSAGNLSKGVAMIDFWANQSMTAAGIPRTDYFAESGNWGSDPLFLRTVSDAAEGVLDAYNTAFNRGDYHDNWLIYVQKFGDFLVAKQAADGSWARSYNPDGSVQNAGKYNTTNPIRFLVKLYLATHDQRYYTAAVNAGNWSLTNVDQNYNYVGGTPDNNNTIDKEAGMMALNAFNALYDVTGDSQWLNAAKNAANYVQSWTFAYNYNVYPSTRWAANGAVYPSWLKVDLGASYSIERVETMFEWGNAYYKYKIETSTDNVNWTTFSDRTGNTARPVSMGYVDSGSATARYVRITVTAAEGGGPWPSIYEFRVYGAGGTNLAQGKTATASSEQDAAHSAAKAVDGVVTSDPKSPWPSAGLVGQSLVATGHSYTDTFMINGPAEFYRLYVATGDAQYLSFAKILANNANAPTDYDGRLGYQFKALLGEGIMGNNFTEYYGLECLTWQLAVQLESIAMLEDLFGYKNIDQIEANLSAGQKQMLNHLNYAPAGTKPVTQIKNGKVYKIVNRNSGKLIDVQGASTANSANIWQYHDIAGAGQQWRAVDQGGGYWKFVNVNSGKVIDVEGSSMANGANISQYTDTGAGATNQQWQVIGVGGGYWKIVNRNSGKAIDVEASGRDDTRNISQYTDAGTPNQQWAFVEVPQGVSALMNNAVYTIVNKNSGKLIDVQGASTANSANIWQYHDIAGTGQQWKAVDQGGGYWKFVNVNSGKVIDVEGSSTANGANISQYTDTGAGATNQMWQVVGVGGGYWKIVNRNSGKLIDVEASSTVDGTNISQYQDMNTANQQWLFNLVQ
ncbi:RICIN domain-containing protein [Paenibacillus whitsoniae]|nr:RICIN domain-containing protein [Paenibacillus whitsoniae]